jgi:hypothetical protein
VAGQDPCFAGNQAQLLDGRVPSTTLEALPSRLGPCRLVLLGMSIVRDDEGRPLHLNRFGPLSLSFELASTEYSRDRRPCEEGHGGQRFQRRHVTGGRHHEVRLSVVIL